MNGNDVAVYVNGKLHKYYKFYQIYDYNFLGFNGNDPIDYIKFDSAEIGETEIKLTRKEEEQKNKYRVTIVTPNVTRVFYSDPKKNMKEAMLGLIRQFSDDLENDDPLSIVFEAWDGTPEWEVPLI